MKVKLVKKSIIWHLVGKMANIAKNTKFADRSTLLIFFLVPRLDYFEAKLTRK